MFFKWPLGGSHTHTHTFRHPDIQKKPALSRTFGIWVAIPANLLHLSSCILAVIYTQHDPWVMVWMDFFSVQDFFGRDFLGWFDGIFFSSRFFGRDFSF